MDNRALNAEDVAALLRIGRNAVYALAKSGELPSYRLGRKLLFTHEDVERFRESRRTTGPSAAAHNFPPLGALSSREAEEVFILGGQGAPLDLLVDRLEQGGTAASRVNLESYAALVALYEGSVDAALAHLYDRRTNSYNVPYVQRLVPGVSVAVMHLVSRQQGFAVAKGNPLGIASWGTLLREDVRLANRPIGSGARVLLDEKLLSLEAPGSQMAGYERVFATGLSAAQAVAEGGADVAVIDETLANQVEGISFVPLQNEWLDLVVSKARCERRLVRSLRAILRDASFRREYARVVQGDTSQLGAIVYEC